MGVAIQLSNGDHNSRDEHPNDGPPTLLSQDNSNNETTDKVNQSKSVDLDSDDEATYEGN